MSQKEENELWGAVTREHREAPQRHELNRARARRASICLRYLSDQFASLAFAGEGFADTGKWSKLAEDSRTCCASVEKAIEDLTVLNLISVNDDLHRSKEALTEAEENKRRAGL